MNKIKYSALIKDINGIDGALLENHINSTGATMETGGAFEKKLNYIFE